MRANFIISGATLALFLGSPAQAQVTLDASKITCDQFVHSKVGEPRIVAAWFGGFYNGKRNNTVFDSQTFDANLTKLTNLCYDEKNFEVLVMQAIERAIGSPKK